MEYIWDEIIPIIKFEKLHIYSKLGLWVDFFVGNDIDIYQLNLEPLKKNW